jgi:branched-chain amino acid transport system substrate-binding protein
MISPLPPAFRSRFVAALLGLALAGGAIVAFSSSGSASQSFKAGLVAVEGPMSGPQASTGIDMFQGAELAANQLNAGGGVNGVKIQLVRADDKASPSAGVSVAHRMASRQIFSVIGPFNSGVGVKNLSIYRSAGISILRLTSARATEGYGVTTQPMDVQVAPVEANEIIDGLHDTRVAIVYDTSTYTAGIASQLKSLLTADGHPPVTFESIIEGQKNFSKVVSKAAAAHPDLLYIAAYGQDAGNIARQAANANLDAQCFVDLAAQGPDFVAAATEPVAENCLNSGVPSAQQFEGAANYVNEYEAAYHTVPGTWGTFTYDSLMLLAQAVKDAGGWNQSKVTAALDHISGYQGITGTVTISPETGNRVDSPVVILNIDAKGQYEINSAWATMTGFPLP